MPAVSSTIKEIAVITHSEFVLAGIPKELQLEAMQLAILLMPDENREVLQSLLFFLGDIAQHSEENQVKPTNYSINNHCCNICHSFWSS